MKYRELIGKSIAHLEHNCGKHYFVPVTDMFGNGGFWMQERLTELDNRAAALPAIIPPFKFYGYLKYGICLLLFFWAAAIFYRLNIFLMPLAVFVFYWCEAHFVFLFPLLIDGVRHPVYKSIKATYHMGVLRVMVTVMSIAVYMIRGLFNRRAPFYNWYVGCMAILIWYQHEVRDRL